MESHVDHDHRVFLVEDHTDLREMLELYIGSLPGFRVCGSAGSAEAAIEGYAEAAPDVMLVDYSLPGMSGSELIERMTALAPDLPCVMLTGHKDPAYVEQAMAVGAVGYVVKGDNKALERGLTVAVSGDSGNS